MSSPIFSLYRDGVVGSFVVSHPDANLYRGVIASGSIVDTVGTATTPTATDTDVSAANDTITLTAHAFGTTSGAGPIQVTSSGTRPAGIVASTNYWIIVVDANTIKLATTPANAAAGTALNITDAGTVGATITFTPWNPLGTLQFTDAEASVANDTITSPAHGLGTGEGPVRLTTRGTLPTGLATATDYWIINSTANAVKLATSLTNAVNGTAIDISALAGGTGKGMHTLDYPARLFSFRAATTGITLLSNAILQITQTTGCVAARIGLANGYIARSFTASDTGGTALTTSGNNCKYRTSDPTSALADCRILNTGPLVIGTQTLDPYPFNLVSVPYSTTANSSIMSTAFGLAGTTVAPILTANEGWIVSMSNLTPCIGTGVFTMQMFVQWVEIPNW